MRLGLHFRLASSALGGWDRLYPRYLEQAEAADSYGFDVLTVAEHHFQEDGYIPAPYVVLGAFAARTRHIRLAAGVRPLPLIHPARAAEDIAVLDNLSGGRAIAGAFGLGGREHEYAAFGIAFTQRRSRYEEALALVDRLLSGECVTHAGGHFNLDRVRVTPRPVQQPRPPLWLAASAEPAVRRAARLAEGWMCKPGEAKADLVRLTTIFLAAAREAGRDQAQLGGPIVRRDGWVARTSGQAWHESLPALHFHYTRDYAFIPPGTTQDELRDFGRDRFLIGDPATLIEEIKWYERALSSPLLVLALDHPGMEPDAVLNAIRIVGEQVLPYVKTRQEAA